MSNQPEINAATLHSVWGRRALDLPPEFDLNRAITPEDVAFLANRSIYIQVINSEAVLSGMAEPVLINTEDGWTIHDYGEAMSVSPGNLLFEHAQETAFAPTEHGKGTLVKQAFDVAHQMVTLAMEKKWSGIEVISGVRLMEWAVWMAAEDRQFKVLGFEPNKEEKERRARILRLKEGD